MALLAVLRASNQQQLAANRQVPLPSGLPHAHLSLSTRTCAFTEPRLMQQQETSCSSCTRQTQARELFYINLTSHGLHAPALTSASYLLAMGATSTCGHIQSPPSTPPTADWSTMAAGAGMSWHTVSNCRHEGRSLCVVLVI